MSATLEVVVDDAHARIRMFAERTELLAAELAEVLARPEVQGAARLDLSAVTPPGSAADFGWVIDAATARPREGVVVSAKTVTYAGLSTVRSLVSICSHAAFDGTFSGLQLLDVRDAAVAWGQARFPDVEELRLRPRGSAAAARAWTTEVIASLDRFPRLRVLRFLEGCGDDFLAALAASPLLPQLRVVDLTDTITNAGAQALHAAPAPFAHLEALWLGTAPAQPLAGRAPRPRGERDIDDAWRVRVKERLGPRVRYELPPGYPHL